MIIKKWYLYLKRKKYILPIYVLYLFLLFEVTSRIYLTFWKDVPFIRPEEIIYEFYPELKEIKQRKIYKGDDKFDILLLGASVFNPEHCSIKSILLEELTKKMPLKFEIHNLAKDAHISLDSLYKYTQLFNKHFDLVLFYHGINEVRANNCPLSIFKNDYSHYGWYRSINHIIRHKEIKFITFPYVFSLAWMKLQEKFLPLELVPKEDPRNDWVEHGKEIKTISSFKNNVIKIIEIAEIKEEPLLIMTFSFYVPEDYTFERFVNNSLDYNRINGYRSTIEIWGNPQNVIAGISAHNKVIKNIVENYPNIYFIDINNLIPRQGKYFNDICHFSNLGSKKFVDNIINTVFRIIKTGDKKMINQRKNKL